MDRLLVVLGAVGGDCDAGAAISCGRGPAVSLSPSSNSAFDADPRRG